MQTIRTQHQSQTSLWFWGISYQILNSSGIRTNYVRCVESIVPDPLRLTANHYLKFTCNHVWPCKDRVPLPQMLTWWTSRVLTYSSSKPSLLTVCIFYLPVVWQIGTVATLTRVTNLVISNLKVRWHSPHVIPFKCSRPIAKSATPQSLQIADTKKSWIVSRTAMWLRVSDFYSGILLYIYFSSDFKR